ncbi:putative myb transcription factor [Cavenderia fasciculata]|uniref:Myb transcription factor n=1 Tax=Cavenderia fasciculata TaxID=261658 RepID=F4PI09_CACFS|nr:putative myb transcription factor [Cavenderia fasciculata]EGG24496.1 putative myb transcription factor [Cavenderia fasciculata]|eukprot:XP_004362347.1 putative myb transcription factor [Cavenderia fasciculata]
MMTIINPSLYSSTSPQNMNTYSSYGSPQQSANLSFNSSTFSNNNNNNNPIEQQQSLISTQLKQQHQQVYSANTYQNYSTNSNNVEVAKVLHNSLTSPHISSMVNMSISSPSPKKRPFGMSIAMPTTPIVLSNNSPYFPSNSSSSDIVVPQTTTNVNPSSSSSSSSSSSYNGNHQDQVLMSPPALSILSPSLLGGDIESPPEMDLEEDDFDEQLRDYLTPVLFGMMDQYSRDHLFNTITDYLNEELSFRNFLLELRVIPIMDMNYKTIFQYLVDLFLYVEQSQKMVSFLKDNGVEENEINMDLQKALLDQHHQSQQQDHHGNPLFNIGLSKKKRERVRKSVSRGLRNPPNKWTKEESQKLIQLVHEHGDKQWKKIAHQIGGGKTGAQCAQHWKRVLCPAIRKGSWDEEEESKLFSLVEKHGQSWKNVASELRTRTDIQCRYQYFKSCMSREVLWSQKEDEMLHKRVMELEPTNMLNNSGGGSTTIKAITNGDQQVANLNNNGSSSSSSSSGNNGDLKEINWMEVSKGMARGRQTKIPRTALECKTRWLLLGYSNTYY